MEIWSAKPQLRVLLDHFGAIADTRQSWKVAYPLREVLFLVVCGTIASGDDYDDIVDWGEAHLSFLRGFSEFHYGIPCADWLRTVMNRIDPELFAACFSSWVAERWPDKPDLVAIDGKTSRRSHDRKRGQKALHLVSAFATSSQLVLCQEAVEEKSNEITAIPALLERLDLEGALVSIDAMGCNPNIAQSILEAKADYLLAVKDNQPTLHADVKSYFETAPATEVERHETLGKDHGRLEARAHKVSKVVDWIASERSYPGAPRFPKLTTIAMVESRIERGEKIETERRSYISSRALSAQAFADSRAKPLGHRKQPALDPRRDLQGGSVTAASRTRSKEHGRHPPLRSQSGSPNQGQTINQETPQKSLMGPAIPSTNPRANSPLTSNFGALQSSGERLLSGMAQKPPDDRLGDSGQSSSS